MSCHSCSRLLARLGTSTVLALLLWVMALEPPLAYALPSTTATPPPATGWYSLRPLFTGLEPQSPVHTSRLGQLLQRLPILLAQATSGYDAGTATAGGLLNTFRLPTEQHLQSVPNYDPAELERQKGNHYYRQIPSRPDSPDPLRDDAAAATDPTLQLVQERATRPPWSIDLKSIDAMQGGQVDIPENGCGLFEYCVTEGAVDRTEECTVHYTYEEATCHEYYSHDVECQTERANGAKAQCTDDRFIYELTRDPDTSEWLFLALDIGPEGWARRAAEVGAG